MTFTDLLSNIQASASELCSINNATPAETLTTIAGLEGLVSILKDKIGLCEESLEEEQLSNGDIFIQDGAYAYAEMPTGQKKWFKKVNEQWGMLKYDPTLSLQEVACNEYAHNSSKEPDSRLQNIFRPADSIRRNRWQW